jgi:hypothetical protein
MSSMKKEEARQAILGEYDRWAKKHHDTCCRSTRTTLIAPGSACKRAHELAELLRAAAANAAGGLTALADLKAHGPAVARLIEQLK